MNRTTRRRKARKRMRKKLNLARRAIAMLCQESPLPLSVALKIAISGQPSGGAWSKPYTGVATILVGKQGQP